MREIPPQRLVPANPWLWVSFSLGTCLAALVVYDTFSTESAALALADAKAKASAREKELQRQVEQLKRSLGESDGRLAGANLRIQELVIEREKRKIADVVMNEAHRPYVSPLGETPERIPKLLAEALKARDEGNLYAAKAKFEAILAINPNDIGVTEGLNFVKAEIAEAEEAKRAACAAASRGSR